MKYNKLSYQKYGLANGRSSKINCLIKDHLQGIRVGIKNWFGCVSRYKYYKRKLFVLFTVIV